MVKLSQLSLADFMKGTKGYKSTAFQDFATWALAFSGSPHAGLLAGAFHSEDVVMLGLHFRHVCF